MLGRLVRFFSGFVVGFLVGFAILSVQADISRGGRYRKKVLIGSCR